MSRDECDAGGDAVQVEDLQEVPAGVGDATVSAFCQPRESCGVVDAYADRLTVQRWAPKQDEVSCGEVLEDVDANVSPSKVCKLSCSPAYHCGDGLEAPHHAVGNPREVYVVA